MAAAAKVKRAGNMASLIYDQVRADILSGKLVAGTPLSQLALAEAAGTSRGPVREALRRLQQDRLVVARANQRFSVAPYDLSDLEAVLCLHLVNVTLAIEVGVSLLSDVDLHHLQTFAAAMTAAAELSDQLRWEAAYRDFILSIAKHAGHRIHVFIAELLDNIQRYRETALSRAPVVYVGGSQIGDIMAAVDARDGRLAASRYAKFAGRTSSLILAGVAPQYEPSRLRAYIIALGAYDVR